MRGRVEVRRSGRQGRKDFSITVISKGCLKMKKDLSLLFWKESHWILLARSVMPMTTWCAVPAKSHERCPKKGERNF